MLLYRASTVAPWASWGRGCNRPFHDGPRAEVRVRRAYPALNVWEEEDRVIVEAEVPGLGLEDLEVSVHGDQLTLKGTRKSVAGAHGTLRYRERSAGEFVRTLTWPAELDASRVAATLKDGVLTITLPKTPQELRRKIEVKTG